MVPSGWSRVACARPGNVWRWRRCWLAMAKTGMSRLKASTVYNTLRAFCDAGLMHEVVVDGSKSYFDTRVDDHPHFFWEETGRLTDAPPEQLEIARLPDAPAGTVVSKVDVVIRLKRA